MRSIDNVSIWIGNICSQNEIEGYVDLSYEENELGELIPSKFYEDFSIDMDLVDEDFIERVCYDERTNDIQQLLLNSSYGQSILKNIDELANDIDYNAKILIYNYNYIGDFDEVKSDNYYFSYLGTVKYESE